MGTKPRGWSDPWNPPLTPQERARIAAEFRYVPPVRGHREWYERLEKYLTRNERLELGELLPGKRYIEIMTKVEKREKKEQSGRNKRTSQPERPKERNTDMAQNQNSVQMNRRGLLGGMLGLLVTPAIIKAEVLMPVSMAPFTTLVVEEGTGKRIRCLNSDLELGYGLYGPGDYDQGFELDGYSRIMRLRDPINEYRRVALAPRSSPWNVLAETSNLPGLGLRLSGMGDKTLKEYVAGLYRLFLIDAQFYRKLAEMKL